MFPDPCGAAFAEAVKNGADSKAVVPDDHYVVRGGTKPLPLLGVVFSAHAGPTLEAAAAAVPYGQIRVATAGDIRRAGGTVEWVPEHSRHGTLNEQHVHVTEGASSSFSPLRSNPVPKTLRIDGGK
jgi:hypothetical protein